LAKSLSLFVFTFWLLGEKTNKAITTITTERTKRQTASFRAVMFFLLHYCQPRITFYLSGVPISLCPRPGVQFNYFFM
jgi:hypothetical protein